MRARTYAPTHTYARTAAARIADDNVHHIGTGLIVFICVVVGVAISIAAAGVIYYNKRTARHAPYQRWRARLACGGGGGDDGAGGDDVNFAQMIDSDWDDSDPFERPRRSTDGTTASSPGQRAHLQINGHHQIYRSVNA